MSKCPEDRYNLVHRSNQGRWNRSAIDPPTQAGEWLGQDPPESWSYWWFLRGHRNKPNIPRKQVFV